MKLRTLALGFGLGVTMVLLMGEASLCSDEAQAQDTTAAEMDQMMKLWQKYALPGEYHKKIELFEGEWDVTTKIWMEGPDEDPNVSHATVWSKSVLGGRFIQTTMKGTMSFEYQGEVMEFPVEGVGYLGYDNFKGKYVSVWMSTSDTGMYYTEGLIDPTGKIFTYYGRMDDWQSGERAKPYKIETKIIDENTIVEVMHDLSKPDGKTLMFEMVSKRKELLR
jgi:hypothetical protein